MIQLRLRCNFHHDVLEREYRIFVTANDDEDEVELI